MARLAGRASAFWLLGDAGASGSRIWLAIRPPTGSAVSARPWYWPANCPPMWDGSTPISCTPQHRSPVMPPSCFGLPWSCSAHAKDVWTTPAWEKADKLADCRWLVTCSRTNREHLAHLAPAGRHVDVVYHGLDEGRFPPPGQWPPAPRRQRRRRSGRPSLGSAAPSSKRAMTTCSMLLAACRRTCIGAWSILAAGRLREG